MECATLGISRSTKQLPSIHLQPVVVVLFLLLFLLMLHLLLILLHLLISTGSIAAVLASRPGPARTSPLLALAPASRRATCTCAPATASTARCRWRPDLLRIHCNRTSMEVRDSVASRIKR